jgi:arsenate reductase
LSPDTDGTVLGWAACVPVSDRCVYTGVVEHFVYVHPDHRGRSVGRALLDALIASTETAGIWTIQSGIFPENTASLALHAAAGFRIVGTRQRLGQHHGVWRRDPRRTPQHRHLAHPGVIAMSKSSVLFVCVHNAGRSQMAAGFLTHLGGGRVEVRSAGSIPGDQVNPSAVAALAELGIDISAQRPKILTTDAVQASDVVITMGCGDACPIFPGKRYLDWDLEDPAGQGVEAVVSEGRTRSIHSCLLADRVILCTVFDRRSTLGLVRFRARRASETLDAVFRGLFEKVGVPEVPAPEFADTPDFATAAASEVDALFGE